MLDPDTGRLEVFSVPLRMPPSAEDFKLDSCNNFSLVPTEETCEGELPRPKHQKWDEYYGSDGSPHDNIHHYEMRLQKCDGSSGRPDKWEFHPRYGKSATIFGYNGHSPGPTFKARYNEPILCRIHNEIPDDHTGFGSTTISAHLHNLHNPSESDGNPDYYFPATDASGNIVGRFKDYHWCNTRAQAMTPSAT